jgi:hypothetical protein
MNRSVLIVTPFFAPQTHAAVFRAYKLAKYLPAAGWKPYVLTVDRNYRFNEDASLLEALPPEVEVHTARHIEPSLRGIRMALGGRDRSFAALKRSGDPVRIAHADTPPSPLQRVYGHVLRQHVDDYWTWYGPAVRKARALIQKHQIPLVYTTALPYTSLRIGTTLQRQGVRWVADFRDPGTYAARMSSPVDRVYSRQRRLEREALGRADVVTVTSSLYPLIFQDTHRLDRSPDVRFIPTGADDELVSAPADASRGRYIIFCGEFLAEYGGAFLQLFARAIAADANAPFVKLLVIGRLDVNQPKLAPFIQALGLGDRVELVDHMRQSDLYPIIKGAMAGVLAPGPQSHWWNNFAKMIDFIALRKTVLALVPDPSEARIQLTATGLGVFLDGETDQQVRRLTGFLSGRLPHPVPNDDACDRYLASRQAKDFSEVFEWCLARSRASDRVSRLEHPAWVA